MPEFLINLCEIPGVPVGRIFVPHSFTTKPNFLRWYQSVEIRRVTPYVSGKVIWFIAPVSEYHRSWFFSSNSRIYCLSIPPTAIALVLCDGLTLETILYHPPNLTLSPDT